MAEAIVTPCIQCVKCVGPPLKKHLYDFSQNVDDFLKKKSELTTKKDSYDQRLAIATRKKELPTKDVKLWIQQYEAIITKCELPEYNEDELERKRRRRYTIKRYKFSRKLVKMTTEITELINRYSKFGSFFVEDLVHKNADILKNFENTKRRLEALKDTYEDERKTAGRSLKKSSPEVNLWIQNYEANITQCDVLDNNLKHYNTTGGVSIDFGELENKENEMKELIHRYSHITPLFVEDLDAMIVEEYAKTKQEFDDMILTYEQEKLKAGGNHKTSTRLVRSWFDDCAGLQKIYGGRNTEIHAEEEESNHHQEEQIRQMEEMKNLITRFRQFNSFSNMFVDQPLEKVKKRSIDYKPLNSMEKIKETVYAALKDQMVIRLFGIGGIGKSTLMQQINEEMSHKTDFKLVIWVTVSTTYANIKDIQYQIYDRLKLQWPDREDNTVRALKISEYLKNSVDGSTLFIFDDVWDNLDLKEMGIPYGTYGNDGRKCCKIILTTRDRNVKVINGRPPKDIKMIGLDVTESWSLFKRYASIDDNVEDEIKEVAEKVCKKCAGLPLVITVIAKMLNREEEKATWYETLTFLNKDDPSPYIPNLSKDVYIPLKLSYDRLGREDLKIGFLLCSLFPEDCEIAVSDLICYGIGAGEIAESCQRLNACHNIFIHLKNKGLLQDVGNDDSLARMHDVIRDVAHFIGKKEFRGFFCNAELTKLISSVQNSVDRPGNVLLLDLRKTSIEPYSAMLYIKKLKELRVLMFSNFYHEIPVNIKEYFILHKLSVLCLQRAHIEVLDNDFSIQLCNLRVIDFSETEIDVIRPKVFSNLHDKLEVLCMRQSFNLWRASDEEDGEYASFSELAELKKLYSLHVDIEDCDIFSHKYRPDLVFSSVECFSINSYEYYGRWNSKALWLPSQRLVKNGANWIKDLFKKTKHLEIDSGNTKVDVVLTYDILNIMCNLEKLFLLNFPRSKYAIQYSSNTEGMSILPKAKELEIYCLEEMENIFVSTLTPTVIPKGSFEKLQIIEIWHCLKLKFIFPWNVVTCLVQLKTLFIQSCDQLEVIVEKEDNRGYSQGEHVFFPELTEMKLSDLPKLECAPSGSDEKLENLKQRWLLGEKSAPNLKLIQWNERKFLQ